MELMVESDDLNDYLASSDVVDHDDREIQALANILSKGLSEDEEIVRSIYGHIQENILHSFDIHGKEVTCKASEVLRSGHGTCYAKADLFAALLRYLGIPVGFCYQKFVMDDEDPSRYVLHGLNAVYYKSTKKWLRVDVRNRKDGVDPKFYPDMDSGIYPSDKEAGEFDYPYVQVHPSDKVIRALNTYRDPIELENNLPEEL
ncbi:transglutaminase-like domain-containing protein [Methanooceanicella nereidis]|nr:transglutaminase family protein [Methanocella sp. CWC-04]